MSGIQVVHPPGDRGVNTWLFGDDDEVVVVDPADEESVAAAIGRRVVTTFVCTSGDQDTVGVASALATAVHAPVALHPSDTAGLAARASDKREILDLEDGVVVQAGDGALRALSTPGRGPGAVILYDGAGNVFTGGLLVERRAPQDPGARERLIRERLLRLPPDTVVHHRRGPDTTIADHLG